MFLGLSVSQRGLGPPKWVFVCLGIEGLCVAEEAAGNLCSTGRYEWECGIGQTCDCLKRGNLGVRGSKSGVRKGWLSSRTGERGSERLRSK